MVFALAGALGGGAEIAGADSVSISYPSFWADLERVVNEKTGKLYTVIRVDDVRRTVPFFGSTAGEGGWRVCIVDTADELQYPQAANALLKILEEPPRNALLLLISHAPLQATRVHARGSR